MESSLNGPSDREPTILVTGGSGFVGSHLVERFSQESQSVVSLYHHRIPDTHKGLYPVCSDMGSPELLAAPLRGVETVFHLAWDGGIVGPQDHSQWDPASLTTLPKNVQTTRNLIAAMEKTGTKRIVFLSALGASRNAQHSFLMEKYLAEFFILNSKIPEKIIVRSSVLWGGDPKQDRFMQSIQRIMRLPVYPIPRKIEGISPLHIDDLVQIFLDLEKTKSLEGCHLVEINGGSPSPMKEFFQTVSDKWTSGSKMGVGGVIGESLMPLFENEGSGGRKSPKLRHFLALGTKPSEDAQKENPLSRLLPQKQTPFNDRITQPVAKEKPPKNDAAAAP